MVDCQSQCIQEVSCHSVWNEMLAPIRAEMRTRQVGEGYLLAR